LLENLLMRKIEIVENSLIAPGIFSLIFDRKFDFIPGQVIKLTSDASIPPRMYSIASGMDEPIVRIIYDLKPEGLLTNALKTLKKGDSIEVSEPFGNFICKSASAWWIAIGTGIAPFYSMFRSGSCEDITLLHGARQKEFFLFSEELAASLVNNYIPCCSGDKMPNTFNGRVTDYIKSLVELPAGATYYLCGSAEMVVEMRDLLISKGVRFDAIVAEIYF